MRFDKFSFGSLQIDGSIYEHDVVIDHGEIRKRKKKPSKKFREDFGHTPLSVEEDIPWKCHRLVVGTGAYGRLPVMQEVQREAARHKVKLMILPSIKAIKALQQDPKDTNAILHVTCYKSWPGPVCLHCRLVGSRNRCTIIGQLTLNSARRTVASFTHKSFRRRANGGFLSPSSRTKGAHHVYTRS